MGSTHNFDMIQAQKHKNWSKISPKNAKGVEFIFRNYESNTLNELCK
jgi:hypothetical protein